MPTILAASISLGEAEESGGRVPRAESPVAAIDCGTNTIRLLIGALPDVAVRESRIVRLGQGVDRSGRLAEEALARTFAALDDYASAIREHGATRVRLCATSAVRDATNGDVFVAGVEERLGVTPDILTGAQEAALGFDGVRRSLPDDVAEPVLVIDVGGGSTELALGSGERPDAADSRNIGSVRLHERHLHSDPPTAEEVARVLADVDAELDAAAVDVTAAATAVAVAGTATTLAAGVLDLASFDADRLHGADLPADAVFAMTDRLGAMTHEQRLALPYMAAGRADVIVAGALVVSRVLRRSGLASLRISTHDILDGIAWSLLV